MKLLLTIVQDADAGNLQQALTEQGYGVTRLASTGGFLRRGNTTLLIGVEDDEVADIERIVAKVCRRRKELITSGAPMASLEGLYAVQTAEVDVGGATIFVLDVESLIKV